MFVRNELDIRLKYRQLQQPRSLKCLRGHVRSVTCYCARGLVWRQSSGDLEHSIDAADLGACEYLKAEATCSSESVIATLRELLALIPNHRFDAPRALVWDDIVLTKT